MLYWLADFSGTISAFNVFRYLTVRTGGSMMTGLVFVFLFGPWIIDHLRLRQGKGQPIREDGPQSHLMTKRGTPTMGGLMILSGVTVSTVLWANPSNPYVWIVLGVTLAFGLVGFSRGAYTALAVAGVLGSELAARVLSVTEEHCSRSQQIAKLRYKLGRYENNSR